MKVSLQKVLAVKVALESLNLLSIPVIDEKDIDAVISLFMVGLADRPDDFNALLNAISEEAKFWDEDLEEAQKVLADFFAIIPRELSVLIEQLRSVSNTLENAVTQMMREELQTEDLATPESVTMETITEQS